MKPYFDKEDIIIYHGNHLEVMSELQPVDLVLTDFPYGTNVDYGLYQDTQDNLKKLVNETMPEILRISKVALITCGNHNIHLYPPVNWILAWVNNAGNGINRWGFNCWQPILAYGRDIRHTRDIIINNERSENNIHPCPKPINFWKQLLLRGSADISDNILDPLMGSGTTLVAAKELGRCCIGIDIEEKWCEEAAKRVERAIRLDRMSFHLEEGKKKGGHLDYDRTVKH